MSVSKRELLADAVLLFSNLNTYQDYDMERIRHFLVIPIGTGNVLPFYTEDGELSGFVSWCFLSDEKSELLLESEYLPTEEDYLAREGDKFWGLEFVAPYGNTRTIFRQVIEAKKESFGDIPVHWRRAKDPERLHKL